MASIFPNRDKSQVEVLEKRIKQEGVRLLDTEIVAYKRVLDNQTREVENRNKEEVRRGMADSLGNRLIEERGWLYDMCL